jgi:DNA-binding MarR family transcriptional regulator
MIEEGTTITRLLDKLETAGLLQRIRSFPDRRQVICHVTAAGRKLLDRVDPLVDQRDVDVMTALDSHQVTQLRFDQVALQAWDGVGIVSERFIYDPATLAAA